MKRSHPEASIQRAIVQGLEAALPSQWIVHHVTNNQRSMVAGANAKKLGAKAGFPDIIVIGESFGDPQVFFLEVKPPKVTVPAYQRAFHEQLRAIGHHVSVVRSWSDVIEIARAWAWPWRLA